MNQTRDSLDRAYVKSVQDIFTTVDGIDAEDYVIARFHIESSSRHDLRTASVQMALVASIGTVKPLPIESPKQRHVLGPRILHAMPSGTFTGDVTIAFPVALFGHADPLTQLIGVTMFGAEYNYVDKIRLESLDLPRSLLAEFPGPKLGCAGLRQKLGIANRPLLGAILKPRLGVDMVRLASEAEKALEGGVDIILDDELMVDPASDADFDSRVKALVDAARRTSGKERKSVVVNVSGRPSKTLVYARKAVDMGAHGLIFNAFVCGFPAMQDLAELDLGVPIFACNVGSGFLTRATDSTGVSSSVYARLSRLAGADAVQTGILAGDAYTTEAWGPSVIALDRHLGSIKPAIPIVAGGLNVVNIWRNWQSLGNDAIFAAGSGIFGFPGGPLVGAQSFRKILAALTPDMSSQEASAELVKLGSRKGSPMNTALELYGFNAQDLSAG